jgi:short-subunit dehydrogenase
VGLSQALYAELRAQGIRVSSVIVGGMKTPFLLERFKDIDTSKLQDPANVAEAVRFVLTMPRESIIPEIMVLPLQESSWP